MTVIRTHLSANGHFVVLLPYSRIRYFEKLAEQSNFYLEEKVLMRQTPSHNFFRAVLFFGNSKEALKTTELIIKREGNYSEEFIQLMEEYYLRL